MFLKKSHEYYQKEKAQSLKMNGLN